MERWRGAAGGKYPPSTGRARRNRKNLTYVLRDRYMTSARSAPANGGWGAEEEEDRGVWPSLVLAYKVDSV